MSKSTELIDRLRNPKWLIPDATLDTVPTREDMRAAANRIEELEAEDETQPDAGH